MLALSLLLAGPVLAEEPTTLGWQALAPEQAPLTDPLAGLDMRVRFDFGFVVKVLGDIEAGRISADSPEAKMALDVKQSLEADGLDTDRLVRAMADHDMAIEQRKSAVNSGIDGTLVRIPGYALPLSAAEDTVGEFLLVPYVGACIHYPPPPPNQIVHARLTTNHSFDGRFDMVWITGRLSARTQSSALDYVDGRANVATSYTMEVALIEPYATDPSAETYAGSFSPTAQAPAIRLSRTGLPHPPLPDPMAQ